jgi:hypothetical protein
MQELRGKGELFEQKRRRKGRRVGATVEEEERMKFMIIIIIGNATVLPNFSILNAWKTCRESATNVFL